MRGSALIAFQKVVQEFRDRIDAGYQQMVTGACAGDVKQMPLGIVDFLKVGIVGYALDPFLKGNDFIVASHHDDGSEFQALGEVHRADGDGAVFDLNLVAEFNGSCSGDFQRGPCPFEFGVGAHKDADLVWLASFAQPLCDPSSDCFGFLAGILAHRHQWRRAVEHRNRSTPPFGIAIDIGNRRRKQAIRV